MSTGLRLLGFAAGVAAVFGVAFAAGAWAGPVGGSQESSHDSMDEGGHGHGSGGEHGAAEVADHLPGGLQVSQDGYTLALESSRFEPGTHSVSFAIEGPDGAPVRDFEVVHDKELHLIAVRRDLAGFQHVHPTRDGRGVWSVDLDLIPGAWRLFADFSASPEGHGEPVALTLGADVLVDGAADWTAPGTDAVRTAEVDGLTVQQAGDLGAGHQGRLTFTVSRGGEPVELEPYLGARGHLVALREGDLAYLHVHPSDAAGAPGDQVAFTASVPSAGVYRLFLDFQVDGVVRTATFTLPASGGER